MLRTDIISKFSISAPYRYFDTIFFQYRIFDISYFIAAIYRYQKLFARPIKRGCYLGADRYEAKNNNRCGDKFINNDREGRFWHLAQTYDNNLLIIDRKVTKTSIFSWFIVQISVILEYRNIFDILKYDDGPISYRSLRYSFNIDISIRYLADILSQKFDIFLGTISIYRIVASTSSEGF